MVAIQELNEQLNQHNDEQLNQHNDEQLNQHNDEDQGYVNDNELEEGEIPEEDFTDNDEDSDYEEGSEYNNDGSDEDSDYEDGGEYNDNLSEHDNDEYYIMYPEETNSWEDGLESINQMIDERNEEYDNEEFQRELGQDEQFIANNINSLEEWLLANMIICYNLDRDSNTSSAVQFIAGICEAEDDLEYYYSQNFSELQILAIMFRYYGEYRFGPAIEEYVNAYDFYTQYQNYNNHLVQA